MTDKSTAKQDQAEKTINIEIDASRISWADFLTISGASATTMEPVEMVKILNKMIVNQDEIKDLPFMAVFEVLQDTLASEFANISNPKN